MGTPLVDPYGVDDVQAMIRRTRIHVEDCQQAVRESRMTVAASLSLLRS